MKITDELLSAFLDNELSEPEMAAVRDQIELDPALADRLAELASVDAGLQRHYGAIDDQPVPDSVTRLLKQPDPVASSNNVVAFPWWRRLREHSGKAVAAAVIAGIAMTQWLNSPNVDPPAWSALAEVLEHEPSGQAYVLGSDITLTPRLTFQNQAGDWCRQFRLDTATEASEQIACRDGRGDWASLVTVNAPSVPDSQRYQTASGGHIMDDVLDQMMAGPPMALDEEAAMLGGRWERY
ncbi:hypothetical protein [Marinobacter sp.]|uniref:hypothetical protein n=1 Tax=Marinobacter sp. TaxID=50741 RepID=UPI0019EA2522|nr:hypothetical protein [Marinobacter sp.]MBE0486397.1 hypothetical protein [Marinobacter sp.]